MIETMRTILMLLPAIIRAVKEIEEVFPESGMGATKLQLVRESLEVVVDGFGEIWPLVDRVIAVVVRVFNEIGLFRQG